MKKDDVYFTTGNLLLDKVVGGSKGVYGFPAGKFVNIVGDKSAGKTFLSNEIIAAAYHKYGSDKFKWVYDDCESGYSFNTNELYGFDVVGDDPVHSETVEDAFCNISRFADGLTDEQIGIYVLDSLDGLTSREQDDRAEERKKAYADGKDFDKQTYGMGKQKYLSQEFFPQLCSVIENKRILVVVISQIRDNIDMFSFEKHTRSGGKAMDFYAHTVLWLATGKKIVKKERPIGVAVKAKTTKSKTPRPYRDCWFTFLYDYGLDDVGSCVDYLYELRTNTGDLSSSAKALQWSESEVSDENKIDWLKSSDFADTYAKSKYYDDWSIESVNNFIASKKVYREAFGEAFGDTMSREELIKYIENNNLIEELHRKVDDKWEALEDEIKTTRRKKYATVD